MKRRSHLHGVWVGCFVGMLTEVAGFGLDIEGYVLRPSIGLNFLESADATLSANGVSVDGEIDFDPGFRLDWGAGWRLSQQFSVGFEFGYIYNPIDGGDSDYHQIPILGVATYQFQNNSKFTPYVAAGAGVVTGIFHFDESGSSDSDSTSVFGYQFGTGITYEISEKMSIGLGYKLLGTAEDRHYDLDLDFVDAHLDLEKSLNHTVAFVFSWSF